jgi:hypothetical protein
VTVTIGDLFLINIIFVPGVKKNSTKTEDEEPQEPLPLELDLTFEIFTLNSFKELKSYLKS